MIVIPLTNIPNQSLSLTLNGSDYIINVHGTRDDGPGTGIATFDIIRNDVAIVTGARALPDFPLIPARYLEDGNFIVETMNDEYPDWRQFGITQNLVYASQDELVAIRAGT
jgi:hypothetical protein